MVADYEAIELLQNTQQLNCTFNTYGDPVTSNSNNFANSGKDWNIERTGYIEQLISSDFRDEELNNIDQSCAETYAPRVLELYDEVIALAGEWIVNETIKDSQEP